MLEPFAKVGGSLFDLSIGIRALSVGVEVDHFADQSATVLHAIRYKGDRPLSSPKGLSFLSKRNAQRSTSGICKLGYLDSDGILIDEWSSS